MVCSSLLSNNYNEQLVLRASKIALFVKATSSGEVLMMLYILHPNNKMDFVLVLLAYSAHGEYSYCGEARSPLASSYHCD